MIKLETSFLSTYRPNLFNPGTDYVLTFRGKNSLAQKNTHTQYFAVKRALFRNMFSYNLNLFRCQNSMMKKVGVRLTKRCQSICFVGVSKLLKKFVVSSCLFKVKYFDLAEKLKRDLLILISTKLIQMFHSRTTKIKELNSVTKSECLSKNFTLN